MEEAGGANEAVLVLTGKELQTPKTMADTYSFDYEEEFIEMCLEMTRFAAGLAAAPDALELRFTEYFRWGADCDYSNHHYEFARLGGFFDQTPMSALGH